MALMIVQSCILILMLTQDIISAEIRLDSSSAVVKKPGETVKISCKISGFTMTSAYMHWIRQKPGEALEWIGRVNSGRSSDIIYADSMKGHFILTEDVPSSTQFLEAKSLRAEDTAVYYCARRGMVSGDYFDYWGKGTSVTVTSGVQSPPTSLFSVSECSPSSDGFLTLGCITSGFSPADSLKFTWTGAKDAVQYPSVQAQGGKYTAVSYVRVKASDWDAQQAFTCKAENSAGSLEKPFEKKAVHVQAATLLLTAPTAEELEAGTAHFVCIASQFTPKEYTLTWMLDDLDISAQAISTIQTEEKSTITLYTVISILKIASSQWIDKLVKCVFKDSNGTQVQKAKYTSALDEIEKVTITPPSDEDMLVRGAGDLQCKATGRTGFKSIRWMRNDQNITSTAETNEKHTSITARAKIDYSDWSKGTVYTCVVEHSLFVELMKTFEYKREDGGAKRCPSVYLLAPPESIQDASVTLTCYVKDFYPREVIVHWLANDEKLNNTEEYQQRTTSLIETKKDLYSVYSQLVVSPGQWESGTTFSCLVYHEAIDPTVRLIARSIDSSSNKPTLVNLSMNVPPVSTCGA